MVTNRGYIGCRKSVNAAGAEAGRIPELLGIPVPILNRTRSIYLGLTNLPEFHDGPMIEDAGMEWYYRALGAGKVLIGMGLEPDAGQSDGPNLSYLPAIRAATARRAPLRADFELVGGSSGVRPLTPDGLPIIGPVPSVRGYVNSCGWGGEGIMHSPAGGSMVADWINDSSTCPVDKRLFLLERLW